MLRYASFIDETNQNEKERKLIEKAPCKIYFDSAYSSPVCHYVIPQNRIKNVPTLLDTLYKSAREEYDTTFPCGLRKTKEIKDKRFNGIKDILKKSMENNKQWDASFEELLENDDIDEYLAEKDKEEYHAECAKKKRFLRKFGMNRRLFRWFITVTMDGSKFSSEEEWLEKLFRLFANNSYRYGIKIMGGIEFGEENGRIHFHAVAYIPEDFFGDGDLYEVTRYSDKDKCWKKMFESKELREKFGINDFERIDNSSAKECKRVCDYVAKYAVKQGGKMYYSRGLPDCIYNNVNYDDLFFVFESGQLKYLFRPDANIFKSPVLRDFTGRKVGHYVADDELPFSD